MHALKGEPVESHDGHMWDVKEEELRVVPTGSAHVAGRNCCSPSPGRSRNGRGTVARLGGRLD